MASGATITISGGTNMQQVVASTDVVEAADYNNPRTNVDSLLGTPADVTLGTFTLANTFGLNQGGSAENAQTIGDVITAPGSATNQDGFKDLQDEVQELQVFLSQTAESVVDVSTGDTISATDYNTLMLAVEDCWNGRFGHTPSAAVTDGSATYTTAWTNTISNVTTYTFASEADCRAFFNGGGRLGVSASRTGGTASDQNSRWTETLTAVGDIFITHNDVEADDGTTSSVGFYDLTATYQQILTKNTTTAPYTGDNIEVEAAINSVTNPTVVSFRITLTDAGDNAIDASPDGTFTFNARRRQPNTAGTSYTFGTPTDSVGAITGS